MTCELNPPLTPDSSPTVRTWPALDHAIFARHVTTAAEVREARQRIVEGAAALLRTPWVAITRQSPTRGVAFVAGSEPSVRHIARLARTVTDALTREAEIVDRPVVSEVDRIDPEPDDPIVGDVAIRCALAVRLDVPDHLGCVLVAFSGVPGFFDGSRIAEAAALAGHAALALASVRYRTMAADLEVALKTNRDIATAAGIVMERLRITAEQALDLLRTSSQDRQMKLHDIAAQVVLTGELPAELPSTR